MPSLQEINVDNKFNAVKDELDVINGKLDTLAERADALETGMDALHKEIKEFRSAVTRRLDEALIGAG